MRLQPDEQSLPTQFPSLQGDVRRRQGAYFTPPDVVQLVLDAAAPYLPDENFHVVDPAAGAGAFLSQAGARWPKARLYGLELSADIAVHCRERVPRAKIWQADALRGGLDSLGDLGFTFFVGNPPYNGTSSLLQDAGWYEKLRALMPGELPAGTSLRDDFAFFLLSAASKLRRRDGVIAFLTPTTLLDSFLYAPLRRALLEQLRLAEVVELGAGLFEGTKVKTCLTVWTTQRRVRPRYRALKARAEMELSAPEPLEPLAPDFLLRPLPAEAVAFDRQWRKDGEPLLELLPVSFPGLKTRFDELLVDDDPERLLARVDGFLRSGAEELPRFAEAHGLVAQLDKLKALRAHVPPDTVASRANLRRFFRYAGARHRGTIPESAHAHCYLDRRLIPRGDHRFRGSYDPHQEPFKLVFNTRELPLAAAIVDRPGCVHAHRHARFAPLLVPAQILKEGLGVARESAELGPAVPNLSPRGSALAHALGGPEALFRAVCAFVNSPEVQVVWAPTFGASRDLCVPLDQMYPKRRRSSHSRPSSATSATR